MRTFQIGCLQVNDSRFTPYHPTILRHSLASGVLMKFWGLSYYLKYQESSNQHIHHYTSRFKCLIINQYTLIMNLPGTCSFWINILLTIFLLPTINMIGCNIVDSEVLPLSPVLTQPFCCNKINVLNLIFHIKMCHHPKSYKFTRLTIGWAEVTILPTQINVCLSVKHSNLPYSCIVWTLQYG